MKTTFRRPKSGQVAQFRRDGFVVLRGLLDPSELRALRRDTARLITQAQTGAATEDVFFSRQAPWRIEYVVDKLLSCRRLLGHPHLVRIVRALQGPSFISTWDSMVFKLPGPAQGHPWHRDAAAYSSQMRFSARSR